MFLVSTYTDGTPPESSAWFCQWLSDAVADFRVQKSMLAGLHFTVFGLGNSVYGENYNIVGKSLFEWLGKLSATVVYPLGLGDQNGPQSILHMHTHTCRTQLHGVVVMRSGLSNTLCFFDPTPLKQPEALKGHSKCHLSDYRYLYAHTN